MSGGDPIMSGGDDDVSECSSYCERAVGKELLDVGAGCWKSDSCIPSKTLQSKSKRALSSSGSDCDMMDVSDRQY